MEEITKEFSKTYYINTSTLGGGLIGSALGGLITNSCTGVVSGAINSVIYATSSEPRPEDEEPAPLRDTVKGLLMGAATATITGSLANSIFGSKDDSDEVEK
ncbi:hypothetical protein [Photobacterium phage PDCC-1]|uniref:Uncharacterized protein n=1 Tax=Photobacterium phage PDCC-1 TaxID=2664246 RepID=A0A6B9J2B5_9CAUD|nr:hypothetical protein HWC77_gp077 [Photobacterium phage PDCC-1]QGZ14440.1 hypothetical protein [Photobacterium phage PDCC-1]